MGSVTGQAVRAATALDTRHIRELRKTLDRMLDAEFQVCTECGNLHMEGGAAPDYVEECAACGGHVTDVELDDFIGL
jgi:rubrerythrin